MDIAAVTQTNQTSSASNTSGAVASSLKKNVNVEDFLKIMVTQMTNQDPMNPMDDKEFIAQMAQFSSLDEMTSLNKTMTSFTQQQQQSAASAYLGYEVTVSDASGNDVKGVVTSIGNTNGKVSVNVGGKDYDISTVKKVSLPTTY